jgi:hypothetical protein
LIFPTTQLLEGYWGPHPITVGLALLRSRVYRRRVDELSRNAIREGEIIDRFVERTLMTGRARWSAEELEKEKRSGRLALARRRLLAGREGEAVLGTYIARQAALKTLENYPAEGHRIMPTRLGNALRRIEDQIGSQYGLSLITIAPHITMTAAPDRAAYIRDTRQEMDLAIRLCSFGLLATVVTTAWLAPAGWWVFVACMPYAVAYVSYRGAISAVQEWGAALAACIDLDRFTMYEALSLQQPPNTREERKSNAELVRVLRGGNGTIQYRRRT